MIKEKLEKKEMNYKPIPLHIPQSLLIPENKTFLTSDCHFLHKRITEITNRPVSKEDHDEWLINQINSVVGINDTVYHLGDFVFGKQSEIERILSRLNGKWLFVLGNHDNKNALYEACKGTKHRVLGNLIDIKHGGKTIVLCHYPLRTWNKSHYGSVNLHGHCHGTSTKRHFKYKFMSDLAKWLKIDHRKPYKNQMDVGIDAVGNFQPIEINEVLKILENK